MYLRKLEVGNGAYCNGIAVGERLPESSHRKLIQSSRAYEKSKANVLHWWIDPSVITRQQRDQERK